MNRYVKETFRIVLPLLILGIGVVAFAAFGRKSPPEPEDDNSDNRPLVVTAPVVAHQGGLDIVTDGMVTPYREITVSAQVGGRIAVKDPKCNEGEYVEPTDTLVQIDSQEYQLELNRLNAELEQAKSTLAELEVDIKKGEELSALAKDDLSLEEGQRNRIIEVARQGGFSDSQVDDARRKVLAAKNAYLQQNSMWQMQLKSQERLKHAIAAGAARRDVAQMNFDRTKVKAPVSGVVISDMVEADSFVQPGATLFTIEDTSAVEVRCNLRLDELGWIWRQANHDQPANEHDLKTVAANRYRLPKTPVKVQFEFADATYQWQGHLTRYDGLGLDEKTRTVACRVVVDDPSKVTQLGKEGQAVSGPPALMRGMYVTVVIETSPRANLVRIPAVALRPASTKPGEELNNVVWRVSDGKLDMLPTKPIRHVDDTMIVDADATGLKVGDELIVSQLLGATPNLAVKTDRDDVQTTNAKGKHATGDSAKANLRNLPEKATTPGKAEANQ